MMQQYMGKVSFYVFPSLLNFSGKCNKLYVMVQVLSVSKKDGFLGHCKKRMRKPGKEGLRAFSGIAGNEIEFFSSPPQYHKTCVKNPCRITLFDQTGEGLEN